MRYVSVGRRSSLDIEQSSHKKQKNCCPRLFNKTNLCLGGILVCSVALLGAGGALILGSLLSRIRNTSIAPETQRGDIQPIVSTSSPLNTSLPSNKSISSAISSYATITPTAPKYTATAADITQGETWITDSMASSSKTTTISTTEGPSTTLDPARACITKSEYSYSNTCKKTIKMKENGRSSEKKTLWFCKQSDQIPCNQMNNQPLVNFDISYINITNTREDPSAKNCIEEVRDRNLGTDEIKNICPKPVVLNMKPSVRSDQGKKVFLICPEASILSLGTGRNNQMHPLDDFDVLFLND